MVQVNVSEMSDLDGDLEGDLEVDLKEDLEVDLEGEIEVQNHKIFESVEEGTNDDDLEDLN